MSAPREKAVWHMTFSTCATFCKRALQNARRATVDRVARKRFCLSAFSRGGRRRVRVRGRPFEVPSSMPLTLRHGKGVGASQNAASPPGCRALSILGSAIQAAAIQAATR